MKENFFNSLENNKNNKKQTIIENKKIDDNIDEYEKNKKYKCANCGKEVKNLEKGCVNCNNTSEYCTENINYKIENIKKEENTLAKVLKIVAWIILVVGFFLGFALGQNEFDDLEFGLLLQVWLLYGGVFLGMYSLAEIIQILHDIRFKVWKK